MAKRRATASAFSEREMTDRYSSRAQYVAPPPLAPLIVKSKQLFAFDPSYSVIKGFDMGAIVVDLQGLVSWMTPSSLVPLFGVVNASPLLFDYVNLNHGYIMCTSSNDRACVYDCKSGELVSHYKLGEGRAIQALAISDSWFMLAYTSEGIISLLCHPWRDLDVLPNFKPTIIPKCSIGTIISLKFDSQIRNMCWICSTCGVFSIDVTLPNDVIVPIMVTLDPMISNWPFSLEYRDLLFRHQQLVTKHHNLDAQAKIAKFAMQNTINPLPITRQLQTYEYHPLQSNDVPIDISNCATNGMERMIFTSKYVVSIDINSKRVLRFPLPPYISAIHVRTNTFAIITSDLSLMFIYYNGIDIQTSLVPLPLTKNLTNTSYVHGLLANSKKSDTGIIVHLKGSDLYYTELCEDSNSVIIQV